MADTAEKLIVRADRKMFYGVVGSNSTPTYTRMKGFTSLTESKNPIEYSRHYVDEEFERTDVTGMSSSYDFQFDLLEPNSVLTDMAGIIDGEKLGSDAVRSFVCVDFHKPVSGQDGQFEAVERQYSIIGDNVGDGTDALVYSGTLRVQTKRVTGKATVATPTGGDKNTVETVTFTADSGE